MGSAKGNLEEFLYDLAADDSLPCLDCSPYESGGAISLFGSTLVKRIDDDICFEEEPIAHSSHRA
jgi:hypothetical protein